jgi:hypothetical protein
MADYKEVYIGNDTPLTTDNLNQIAQNQQYLFDKLNPAARGMLAWKKITSNIVFHAGISSTANAVLASLDFTCESGRRVGVGFSSEFWTMPTYSPSARYEIHMRVDGVTIGGGYASDLFPNGNVFVEAFYESTTQGTHTLQVTGNNAKTSGPDTTIPGSASNPIYVWAIDYGGV